MLVDLPPEAGKALRRLVTVGVRRGLGKQIANWITAGWARGRFCSSQRVGVNMNRVVELGAQDRATLGRAFSAGVSNAGVFGTAANMATSRSRRYSLAYRDGLGPRDLPPR